MNVKLLESTPNPIETIYRAYRICYSKDVPTEIKIPTIETSIGDLPDKEKMLNFIKKYKKHESPLEHVSFTFAIEGVSRSLTHQLVRHRLASFSQQSQRYVDSSNFNFVIPKTIKNNSNPILLNMYNKAIEVTQKCYKALISNGIPKEDARYVLPNATTTNIIVTMNTRELIHFFNERLCKFAQWEIRELAEKMRKQANTILPLFDRNDVMKCNKTCFECENKKLSSNNH